MPDYKSPPLLPRLDPEEAGYLGEELESLRALVSRGDALATAGGSVMAWWGVVLAVTHILKALMAADWLPAGLPIGWGAAIIGVPGALLISHYGRGGYSFRSWRNQASDGAGPASAAKAGGTSARATTSARAAAVASAA